MNISEIYELYKKYPVVITDTRKCEKNSIFIALRGDNFDGNTYVEQALEKGCAYAIGDSPELPQNEKIIRVENALETLQKLAQYHRRQLKTPIIAITGTNGKTTTKELTASVLSSQYNILYTQGNLNNHIGVPLTLLSLTKEHQFGIIEMGANHGGEIKTLAAIAEPDYGLITNVGKAHLEGFGSFENVIKTKGELYDYIRDNQGTIFINHENTYLNNIATGIEKVFYGKNDNSFVWGEITKKELFLTFDWVTKESRNQHHVSTHLIGEYNLENALAAITIGTYFKVSPENISSALSNYIPQNNRSQFKKTEKNSLIIDAYNANPTSMLAALQNFQEMDLFPKMVILGEMKELGSESINEHQKIVDFIRENKFEKAFLCGDIFVKTKNNPFPCFNDSQLLIEQIQKEVISNYYILIKGSRGVQLEKVIEFL